MPAKSKSQQRLFGMALAQKRGKIKDASKKVKTLAKEMPEKELEKYAKTKHKGLKENHVLSFNEYVNEAYIDSTGTLQDLEFSPEEKHELSVYDSIMDLIEFLKDAGAAGVKHKLTGRYLDFFFNYSDEPYLIHIDLDTSETIVTMYPERISAATVYEGSAEDLIDLIRENGISFLRGY